MVRKMNVRNVEFSNGVDIKLIQELIKKNMELEEMIYK